ncbi:hypothetical protein H8356DRAFT_1340780 [Neocallimastix lanati (nom. inval.)]|nr:hypothetical protein H8356DRAFT_1340780 [Neocallimastix sp. JGI-2020a]
MKKYEITGIYEKQFIIHKHSRITSLSYQYDVAVLGNDINDRSDILSNLIKDSNVNSNSISQNYNKLSHKLPRNIQSIEDFQNESFSKAIDKVASYIPTITSKLSED